MVVVAVASCGFSITSDALPIVGRAQESLAVHKQQQPPTSVTKAIRGDGSVRVVVVAGARKVQVKFRSLDLRIGLRTKTLAEGQAKFLLPVGAHRIKARAMAASKRAASIWVRARFVAKPPPPPSPDPPPAPQTGLTKQDLATVASTRSFFGHQSVGGNILGAVPAVYEQFDVKTPPVVELPATLSGGGLLHAGIGTNGKPLSKIADFANKLGSEQAKTIDVAFMKFCYVDITTGTDVNALFAAYRDAMKDLQNQHPGVVFLHVTAPLTTDNPADNVQREKYNALMRSQYAASGRLFDLAAIESTRPDGTRVTGTYSGSTYFALNPGYASDNGHLNAEGAEAAASGMLDRIASSAE
jgi:hypothetical protein